MSHCGRYAKLKLAVEEVSAEIQSTKDERRNNRVSTDDKRDRDNRDKKERDKRKDREFERERSEIRY